MRSEGECPKPPLLLHLGKQRMSLESSAFYHERLYCDKPGSLCLSSVEDRIKKKIGLKTAVDEASTKGQVLSRYNLNT